MIRSFLWLLIFFTLFLHVISNLSSSKGFVPKVLSQSFPHAFSNYLGYKLKESESCWPETFAGEELEIYWSLFAVGEKLVFDLLSLVNNSKLFDTIFFRKPTLKSVLPRWLNVTHFVTLQLLAEGVLVVSSDVSFILGAVVASSGDKRAKNVFLSIVSNNSKVFVIWIA